MKAEMSRKKNFVHIDVSKPEYNTWRKFLEDSDNWTRDQINEYQFCEIKRILRYAYENTKEYRYLYDKLNLKIDEISSFEDLHRFPFVTKEMIRDNLDGFSVSIENRSYTTTGGSTGIPFGFYRDPKSFPRELASKAHQYYRVGWKEGDKQIVFRGLKINSPDHIEYKEEFNELRFSSYHLAFNSMEVYRQRAIDYKPEWIRCYPSSGYVFASWLKETGREFPPVKGILCASENLYDFQKDLLMEVFDARVFSHYGHYELAVLAGFCEYEDTYHVLPQYGYAELIDTEGQTVNEPGQMGEIVGTSFIMHATPFIRYRTRDFAALRGWGCSSCGRPYQIWDRIEGRLQEFIVTHTGRLISMTAINFHDDIFDHIRQFEFHQKTKGWITFRYIPKDTCNEAALKDIRKRLEIKLGEDVDLIMHAVEDIPRTERGKSRFLIQELDIEIK